MKSKKKFLLLGVGVMGALALGVGATSTFAWYSVTKSVTIGAFTPSTATITASNNVPTFDPVTVSLEVSYSVQARSGSGSGAYDSAMEMTTYRSTAISGAEGTEDNDHFYFGYYKAGNTSTVYYSANQFGSAASVDFWRVIKVHVGFTAASLTAAGLTAAEAAQALQSAASNNKISVSVEPKDATSRAKLFRATSSTTAGAEGANSSVNIDSTANTPEFVAAAGNDYYFGMYVEGDTEKSGGVYTPDTNTDGNRPNGSFKVSIAIS